MKTKHIMIMAGLATMATAATAQDAPAAPAAPAALAAAPAPAPAKEVTPEQVKKCMSYFVGYKTGQDVAGTSSTISVDDFDPAVVAAAFVDSLKGAKPAITEEELAAAIEVFRKTLEDRLNKQAEENGKKGEAYMAEFAKKEGVVKTESGLMYRVIAKGDGRKYDEKTDGEYAEVSVKYRGTHVDGTEFDASETPVPMPVTGVVPGFSEALKLMPIGSKWEIVIPGKLAYGQEGRGPIGPNETLIFTLEVTDIQKGQAPAMMPMQITPEMLQQMQQQGLPTEG